MNFLKKTWLTFRQLKTWIQVVIVLIVIGLFGAAGGSGSSTSINSESSTSVDNSNATKSDPIPTKPAVSDAEFKAALAYMRIKTDSVKNTKYYRDKSSPQYVNQNGFDIYTGGSIGGTPSLFLEIQYAGSDWLFIDSYFFNVDGVTTEINPSYGTIQRDNNTDVWEWYNEPLTSDQLDLIQRIIKSKKAVVRLQGSQYYKDVTITASQNLR